MSRHLAPRAKRPTTRRRAQALVEFALIAPILLFMLLMAVDFGRLFYSYIGINNAAREGATYAAQYGASQTSTPDCANASACADPDNIVFHARQEMGGDTTLTVTSICPSTCKSSSTTATNLVRVTSSQQFTFITPLISGLMGGPLNISASVSAIIL